jgi:ribosomal protein S7
MHKEFFMRLDETKGSGKKQNATSVVEESTQDVEVFTKNEACRFLKCGMSTLPKLNLPMIKIGRSVKYLKSDLEAFLLSNRKGGSDE